MFDWSLTIAHYPDHEWWVVTTLERLGRSTDRDFVAHSMASIAEAVQEASFIEAQAWMDTSAELHRTTLMDLYQRAGLDDEFAEALSELESDPFGRPLYADVPDVLASLRELGIRIALVSNIHFDVRPALVAQGIARFFDAVTLSFELGVQKPDPAMFQEALRALDVRPEEALMVGDSPDADGAAAWLGITTLILPRAVSAERDALHQILRLAT
jgi:HAD superfamily hydrolase (TIGR01509 family)